MSVTNIYQCPECKVTLRFDFEHTNLKQCAACHCVIYKDDNDQLSWIRDKKIVDSAAIIQPGTTGEFRNVQFSVAGRFRTWADDSVINFWTLIFKNGRFGILAEGYGLYRVVIPFGKNEVTRSGANVSSKIEADFFTQTANLTAPKLKLNRLWPGKSPKGQQTNGDQLITRSVTKADRWDMEGEVFLPINDPVFIIAETTFETKSKSVPSTDAQKEAHTNQVVLSFGANDKDAFSFIGEYADLAELKLKNLRAFKKQEYALTCEKCNKPVDIKRFPYTKSVVCGNCGAFYRLDTTYRFKLKTKVSPDVAEVSRIPLNSKGSIDNIEYEVIGFACKEEINEYRSRWREYVLFNESHGYAFLSEFDGHWILLRQKTDHPDNPGISHSIDWENEPYRLYNRYTAEVIQAAGEFPYNLFDARRTEIREFISPPEMWSFEKQDDDSFTWYHGRHMDPGDVSKAFPQVNLPSARGVGAIQPTGYASNYQLVLFALFGLMIMWGIHFFISTTKAEREVYSATFTFDSLHRFQAVSPEFVFEKSTANVELSVLGQLNNSWMEVAATLVNKTTGNEYAVEQGIEYYSGYSEGEFWSEGSLNESAYFNAIPAGRYVLQLDGTREATNAAFQDCRVALIYDVSSVRNFWWCYLIFLFAILIKFAQVYYYEYRRWKNSPFSNYD